MVNNESPHRSVKGVQDPGGQQDGPRGGYRKSKDIRVVVQDKSRDRCVEQVPRRIGTSIG